MPPKARKKAAAHERPPLYDPAVHTDAEQLVFVELSCSCGSLWRQRDPVAYVAPRVVEFIAAHTGRGHGAASKADCIRAREQRREAMYVARGQQAGFRARDYPHVDTTDGEVRPWPRFPVRPPAVSPSGRAAPAVPRRLTEGREG